MSQNVLITGTGREMALGFHLVRRCLERGDLVFAGVRKPSEALERSKMTPLIVNVSSEAGSIGACYRSNMTDYAITKASLNMITKTLFNAFKEADKDIRIMALHPGWMRTNEGNKEAPLIPREHAETLLKLFEERRGAEDEELFVTYEGGVFPW